MEHIEVLETRAPEREPWSTRRRWLVVAAAAAAVVLAGVVWSVDQSRREAETASLTRCVTGAEQTGRAVDARVDMMRMYIAPVLGQNLEQSTRNGLFVLVRQEAAEGLPAVERSASDCRKIRIRTWHGDLRTAQADFLTYLDARTGVLRTVSADGGLSLKGDEGVPALRQKALTSLKAVGITP